MKEFSSILTRDSSAFRARICLFLKKMVKDWIIVIGSQKGYRLLSYVSPQENIHLTVKRSIRYCEAI